MNGTSCEAGTFKAVVIEQVQWCALELLVLNSLAGKKTLEIFPFFCFRYRRPSYTEGRSLKIKQDIIVNSGHFLIF